MEAASQSAGKPSSPENSTASNSDLADECLAAREIVEHMVSQAERLPQLESHSPDLLSLHNAREILNMARRDRHDDDDGASSGREVQETREERRARSALAAFGTDLTDLARAGKLDPVVGRDADIERALEVLCRRSKSNPLFLGDAGVGKTALVEGLAQRIATGAVPPELADLRIISLDLSAMVSGTMYRGQFEERVKAVVHEAIREKNVVLFIDEIHTVVGAGGVSGSMDASNILKPELARGALRCIGATTTDEFRKYIEKDAALTRRFQPISLAPPSGLETIEILYGLRSKYEAHHLVRYTDEAIATAALMSERYITNRNQPDKSIDLLDEAGARKRIEASKRPRSFQEQEDFIDGLLLEQSAAVLDQDYGRANRLGASIAERRRDLDQAERTWRATRGTEIVPVTKEDILAVLSEMTGIPLGRMKDGEKEQLLHLEDKLRTRVVGQDEALSALARAVRRARAGMKDPNRPIGSFVFVGPSGTGKSLASKALAEFLFDDPDALVTLDMSEYMEKENVSRLVGAPPGYVGYEDGGQLTEQVRRRPYCVVLLDEIEKAHPDVFNMLLQVLEEGRLTDSFGREVDFRNTIIIMSSNLGTSDAQRGRFGFFSHSRGGEEEYQEQKRTLTAAVEGFFRPELINRLDGIVAFRSLSKQDMGRILELELDKLGSRLQARDYSLVVSDEAKEFLLGKGYDATYNARPMRRAIGQYLENPLVEAILRGDLLKGRTIHVLLDRGCLRLFQDNPYLPEDLPNEIRAPHSVYLDR